MNKGDLIRFQVSPQYGDKNLLLDLKHELPKHKVPERTLGKPFKRFFGGNADVISLTQAQRAQAIEDAFDAFLKPWSEYDVYDVTERIKNAKGETVAAAMRPKVASEMIKSERSTAIRCLNAFEAMDVQKYLPNAIEQSPYALKSATEFLAKVVKFFR